MTPPSQARPPAWAEATLALLLAPADRESVTGDLLEEYRDSIRGARGRWLADAWYLRQLAGFIVRTWAIWGAVLAASVVGRYTVDWWLSPTDTFYARSVVSTAFAASVFFGVGLWSAWRSQSVRAGALAGITTGAISAVLVNIVSLVLLAIWHDPHTMTVIRASGGLDEAFTLPLLIILPGTMCAAFGAVVGKTLAWSRGSRLGE